MASFLKARFFQNPVLTGDALVLTVDPTEYFDKLVDYCMIKVYAVIRVAETNQFWSEEDDFSLVKPKLKVEQLGQLYAGRMGRIRLSFINPLEVCIKLQSVVKTYLTVKEPKISHCVQFLVQMGPLIEGFHCALRRICLQVSFFMPKCKQQCIMPFFVALICHTSSRKKLLFILNSTPVPSTDLHRIYF